MKENIVVYHYEQDVLNLTNPVMIVGLPGVGHVGKFVADHLVEVLESKKIVDIYSAHFPPQVMVEKDSTIKLVGNQIYVARAGHLDLLILVGDSQSSDTSGHYNLCELYINIAAKFGVRRIFTLGGYPTGMVNSEDYVIGAVNNPLMIDNLSQKGIEFKPSEPPGGIVGASGLILAFSQFCGIDAACLMGTTSGYIADPKSSKILLEKLSNILEIDVDSTALDEKIREMEKIVEKLKDSAVGEDGDYDEGSGPYEPSADDDLVYFG
ncbi:proteasome assembly chaperone family protein [Methanolapillus millepedarum]|uniref:Proteasome assembly chaperone family protein n=1 Tax=Methanolapillus millepedarum TaxID=3028296 RepID=A0AA96V2K4_9EURY|nr:hypothetical protein MsAc7_08050 [Methanosarcinaceae archaeon Ac7]